MKNLKKFIAAALIGFLFWAGTAEAALSFSVESIPFKPYMTGGYRFKIVEVTLDASYTLGGYAVTPANFGLVTIKKLYVMSVGAAGSGGSGYGATWDRVNSKIKFWRTGTAVTTPLQEVAANEAGLNGLILQVLAIGT
jgi:hypothetical protein